MAKPFRTKIQRISSQTRRRVRSCPGMVKPKLVDSMVNMATALVIHSTNIVVARTRYNRRTPRTAKLRLQRFASSILETKIIDELKRFHWFSSQQASYNRLRDSGISSNFACKQKRMSCTRQGCRQYKLSHAHFVSVVSPCCVSHCTSHFPIAHICTWLKTCRGRVLRTPAHSSKVILSSSCYIVLWSMSMTFPHSALLCRLHKLILTRWWEPGKPQALLRTEGCCLAFWPITTLLQNFDIVCGCLQRPAVAAKSFLRAERWRIREEAHVAGGLRCRWWILLPDCTSNDSGKRKSATKEECIEHMWEKYLTKVLFAWFFFWKKILLLGCWKSTTCAIRGSWQESSVQCK